MEPKDSAELAKYIWDAMQKINNLDITMAALHLVQQEIKTQLKINVDKANADFKFHQEQEKLFYKFLQDISK